MKQKFRKFLFIFVIMIGFIFSVNVDAKIKEDSKDYKGDVYIIGSSKFDTAAEAPSGTALRCVRFHGAVFRICAAVHSVYGILQFLQK